MTFDRIPAAEDVPESSDPPSPRASPSPARPRSLGAADDTHRTTTTPTGGRPITALDGPAALHDASRATPDSTADPSTGGRLSRHRTSTPARRSRFQPLAFVESSSTALQPRSTADRISESTSRASTLNRTPAADGVIHGVFSDDVSVVSYSEDPDVPGILTTTADNWRGTPVGIRVFPARPVTDTPSEGQTAGLASKWARTDRQGSKELSDPSSWAFDSAPGPRAASRAPPCTPPSPIRTSDPDSPPATASWPNQSGQLAYSTSDYFQTLCAHARVHVPRAGTRDPYEAFERHEIRNPAALADDLGASVRELGAIIVALESFRLTPNGLGSALSFPLPEHPAYILCATVVTARALGDEGVEALADLAANAAGVLPWLGPPFGEYKTSFTDECAALTISPPSLLGSLRFEKALCIEEQPPLDTAIRTQRIAAAAWLQWLARQPRGVIRSNWPGPSPMAARFVRSMVARSYNAGRRGTGPLFEAAVACEIATMDERLVDPLPSVLPLPAPVRSFPPGMDLHQTTWLALDPSPATLGIPALTLGEAIARVRHFRDHAGPGGLFPALLCTGECRIAPMEVLVPDAASARLQTRGDLDSATWLPTHYYARSLTNTASLEAAARVWITTRDPLPHGANFWTRCANR